MYKQLIDACQYDEIICFQTAIGACMKYKKGKCDNNLNQIDKPQNFIRKKIDDEVTMIKTLGYNVERIDEKYDQTKLDIPCYQNNFSIIKVTVPIEALNGIEIDILFYIQNPDNYVQLTQTLKQNFDEVTIPLIIDQGTYKYNLQLQGCYPYCMPVVNIQSNLLSSTGKSIIIQHIYQILQKNEYNYNSMRIFNSIIDINNGLKQKLEQAEQKLHLSFNKSTLNLKQIKQYKHQLQNSYIQRVGLQIQEQTKGKMQFLIVNPFLTILNDDDKDRVVSSIKIWYCGEQRNITVKQVKIDEDEIKLIKQQKIQFFNDKQLIKQEQQQNTKQKILQNMKQIINNNNILNKVNQNLKNQFLQQRQKLPVIQNQDNIYNLIKSNNVSIITAETGTGKSTNIPQIILEREQNSKILVTQPRRIAAISLAKRVQQETGLPWIDGIGYQVLNDNQTNQNSIITYVTIGIILRKCYQDLNILQNYTHIIIDEVHEKSVEVIVFLQILRILLEQKIKLPKIIIMSATMDAQQLIQYFAQYCPTNILSIKGKQFNLDIKYDNNKLQLNDEDLENEIDNRIRQILYDITKNNQFQGNILVFLPGIREIQNLSEQLSYKNYNIIQCHSKVNQQEINKLFQNNTQNQIILATNIAEASITIPNVKVVIDSGLERRVTFSLNKSKYTYSTVLISKQSAIQRAGRAGRISDGIVYRCYSEEQYQQMSEQKISDVKISDLSGVFINLYCLYQDYKIQQFKPEIFFQESIEKVDQQKIQQNINWLINQNFINQDQNDIQVTQIGQLASQLPIQPLQSKIIILCKQYELNIKNLDIMISILNADQIQFKQAQQQKTIMHASNSSDILDYLDAYQNNQLTKKSMYQINEQLQNICSVIKQQKLEQYPYANEKQTEFLFSLINKKNIIYKNIIQSHFYQLGENQICDPNKSSALYKSNYQLLVYYELLKSTQFTTALLCNRCFVTSLLIQYQPELVPNDGVYTISDCNIKGNLRDITIIQRLIYLFNNYGIGKELILKLLQQE